MSKASNYGVAVIECRFGPVMPVGLDYEDPITVAGDQLAYWLHWVASQAGDHLDAEAIWEQVCNAAWTHFEAEHNGDDISNDPSYDDMIERLMQRRQPRGSPR